MTVSSGLGFYNVSVILNALVRDGGYPVGLASVMTTLFFLVGAMSGLVIGRLIDRYDPRYTICAGAFLGAAGMIAIGQATSLSSLAMGYVLFAIGFAASGLVPGTTIVARWFHRKRATALSLASTGLSLGGITLTPFSAALIGEIGLRDAMPWLAALYVLGIVPVTVLVLRASPAAMGLRPDGDPAPIQTQHDSIDGVPFGEAVRTRFYIVLTAAFTLILMAQVGGMSHQFNLVAERVDMGVAANAVAVLAASSLIGRLIGGILLSRVSIRVFALLMVAQQAVGLGALGMANDAASLLVVSVLFGLTIGNLLMLLPLIVAEVFGVRDYGKLYSTAQVMTHLGVAFGPAAIGIMHDATAGYATPLLVVAITSACGGVLLLLAGPFSRTAHHHTTR
ncbi:MAG: MFS transporter [Rhodospirillales bacterium]|nr:MFS transporter [Rhodospirillales bacterium]